MVTSSNRVLLTKEIGSLRKPRWLLKYVKSKGVSEEEKRIARDEAALVNIKILESIGLDYVYDGEVRRVEMYEYPIRHIQGFEFVGNVRSFDNKYYRKARCVGPVKLVKNYHMDEFLFVKRHAVKLPKIPVTGAYTLAEWSFNEYYQSKEEFAISLARNVIRPLIKELVDVGARVVQIDEPAATTHPDEIKLFVEVFNESVRGVNAEIHLHICYSADYRLLYPHILEAKAHHYALEFANRDSWSLGTGDEARPGYEFLKTIREYGDVKSIGVGVIDVHTDDIEPPELIRDRVLYAVKVIGDPARVMVNPDCGLRTRSRPIAFKKLEAMVRGVNEARKRLG